MAAQRGQACGAAPLDEARGVAMRAKLDDGIPERRAALLVPVAREAAGDDGHAQGAEEAVDVRLVHPRLRQLAQHQRRQVGVRVILAVLEELPLLRATPAACVAWCSGGAIFEIAVVETASKACF